MNMCLIHPYLIEIFINFNKAHHIIILSVFLHDCNLVCDIRNIGTLRNKLHV